jgi:hypothetical protein
MTDTILTRDLSSGRIHKRYLTESGALASLEGCNLDEAGDYEVITDEDLENAAIAQLCANDFPYVRVVADLEDAP